MKSRIPSIAAAVALAVVFPLAAATPATAAESKCITMRAKEKLTIRFGPGATHPVGYLEKGSLTCVYEVVGGTQYKACGKTSATWARLSRHVYDPRYVAYACLVKP
ncbi:hypothetical protein [Streptomyces sp. NPDC050585]|uniref:hypothetical protein n=1 Tax=Streptomyces sp. NPDC050585 TaxID=3365632 RepID=UPI00378C9F11